MAKKAKVEKRWTAKEVVALLDEKYTSSEEFRCEWLGMSELELPEVSAVGKRRRVDYLAVNLWWGTRGFQVVGHEIKVTRADWVQEMDLFGKGAETARYCTAWYVVAPKGVVRKGELPKGWGLLDVVGKGTLRTNVSAAMTEATFDQEFAWRVIHRAVKQGLRQIREAHSEAWDAREKSIDDEVDRRVVDAKRRADEAEGMLDTIRKSTGLSLGRWGELEGRDVATVKALVRSLDEGEDFRRDMRRRLDRLKRTVEEVETLLGNGAAS